MILHIPHSSTKMKEGIFIKRLKDNKNLYTDWFTDELFFHEAYERIVFPYSRFVCDVERLENDYMNEYGLGKFYTKDVFGNPITREQDYSHLYEYHHEKLNEKTNFLLGFFKNVTIVDCHSFNDDPFYFEMDVERPDICLGINNNNSIELVHKLIMYFSYYGLKIFINAPYKGSIVPSWFINDPHVNSIMIEVNKKLYLDYKYLKNKNFNKIQNIITGALDIINGYTNKT